MSHMISLASVVNVVCLKMGFNAVYPKKNGSTHDVIPPALHYIPLHQILVHCTALHLVKWFPIRLFDMGLVTHTPLLGCYPSLMGAISCTVAVFMGCSPAREYEAMPRSGFV